MSEETRIIQVNGKYRMVMERAASTKGVDGFKVEANGDDMQVVMNDIQSLYQAAEAMTSVKEAADAPYRRDYYDYRRPAKEE